jgi:hypothetical protein
VSNHNEFEFMPEAVKSAYQIVDLWEQNQELRYQNKLLAEYEDKYHQLLNESVKHGQTVCAEWVRLLLTKDITDRKLVTP